MTSSSDMGRTRRISAVIAIAAIVALVNAVAWWWLNRPVQGEGWDGQIQGVAYNPFRPGQKPFKGPFPTAEQIAEDLTLLAPQVRRIRTYSVLDGLDAVPAVAADFGLPVTLGVWLDTSATRNEAELEQLGRVLSSAHNIERIIVGNEAILRGDLTAEQLSAYLRRVRAMVRVPISTAEPWHIWLKHPELADEVDFITIHVLPYWEGVDVDSALEHVRLRLGEFRRQFPFHNIVIGEVGWPSDGPVIRTAKPGLVNEATFIRRFANIAAREGIDYYVMEAFDQPWKLRSEGTVGANWGLYRADRSPKFPLTGPVSATEAWPWLAAISTLLALAPMTWFLLAESNLRVRGRLFFASLIQLLSSLGVAATFVLLTRYATPETQVVWTLLSAALLMVAAIIVTEGLEFARVLWRRQLVRRFPARARIVPARWPLVSLHVPAYNEPPEMMIATLNAIARLDYPNLEVLVIDNNTRDPEVWRPVEAHCRDLGDRFRFFHLDHCPGFKAGALNFALAQTHPDAEVIAVIDSDYQVDADWLRGLLPYFEDPAIGFVQAPQDYRDWPGTVFKQMCYWEYAGFFHIGMVERNEHSAIIQHGTMTLIRRDALDRLGGWAEWCITEDAELGLRLTAADYRSVYVKHSYGRGLTPDSFAGYKSQRFRWAYGAVQTVKRHWREFVRTAAEGTGPGRLSAAQRYHYVAGWLPWLADAVNLVFLVSSLAWSVALVLWPRFVEFPLSMFMVAVLALIGFKTLQSIFLYGARVRCSLLQTLGAGIAGLSLSYTVGKAVLSGVFTSGKPFLRTPKLEGAPPLVRGLAAAWEEIALMLALWTAAGGIAAVHGLETGDARLWFSVLLMQSLPLVAACVMAVAGIASSGTPRSIPLSPRTSRGSHAGLRRRLSVGALPPRPTSDNTAGAEAPDATLRGHRFYI